jgi:hypothetical protein
MLSEMLCAVDPIPSATAVHGDEARDLGIRYRSLRWRKRQRAPEEPEADEELDVVPAKALPETGRARAMKMEVFRFAVRSEGQGKRRGTL